MILRRLAEALRRQDWLTVAVEFLIVVAGIFVGLQVSDWNEQRKAREEELVYLERLLQDLDESIADTSEDRDFQVEHARQGALVLRALKECRLRPDERDEFATGLYRLGKIASVSLARATIDELRSTGKFTLLRNTALRTQISNLLQEHQRSLDFIGDLQNRLGPQINYVDRHVAILVTGPIGGGASITGDQLEMDFQALCNDPLFYNAVAASINYTWDVTAGLDRWLGDMAAVRGAIAIELGQLTDGESP